MEEFNILPIYRNGIGEITSGIDIPIPKYCQDKHSCEKCRSHYIEMESASEGVHTCPYGFQSYVFKSDEESYIFTCLRIENEYSHDKLMPKIKAEPKAYRELSLKSVEKYAAAYIQFHKKNIEYNTYRRFIEEIFHDIRKFIQDLHIKNDNIYRKTQNVRKMAQIFELSKSINAIGEFMSLRMSNHDFVYNEGLATLDVQTPYNMGKIFHKACKCLEDKANTNNVHFSRSRNSDCRDMMAYSCIELLPYILLDNAIKYSPPNSDIIIDIHEKGSVQYVSVKSLGPVASPEEVLKFTQQGYRGENASKITSSGMGIGLYTAKRICAIHNIQLKLKSSDEIKKIRNGVDYSEFIVDIYINL